jgi:hypothetical protein
LAQPRHFARHDVANPRKALMHKLLRAAALGLIALAVAVTPLLGQEQQSREKFVGVYEFEAPDYGVIAVTIGLTEENELTISAMGNAPETMKHLSGNRYQFNSPDYGLISIGFVEEEDGTVSSITIDSYDFSFIAVKKRS